VKTLQEIEELKAEWASDPVWDIEDTEGFEDHSVDLLAWRIQHRAKQEVKQEEIYAAKAKEVGCEGNRELGKYLFDLECRLKQIEDKER